MAMATGRPRIMKSRKEPSRISMARPSDRSGVEVVGPLQDRVALAPVLDRDLDRAQEHEDEAGKDGTVDQVLGQIDRGHGLALDQGHEAPDEPSCVGEEQGPDDVDGGRQYPCQAGWQIAEQEVDVDMPAQAD